MVDLPFEALLFALTFIGLTGFSTAPYRAYEAARFVYRSRASIESLSAMLAAGLLLYAWGSIYQRIIFGCLVNMVCGPNRSQGILLLAGFGIVVAGYELLRLIAMRLYRRQRT
ncbi:hypothetical protein ACG04R_24950 [Roseateles sp. BYS78W]|uniref:Uncharacterized protein n=1 Tax=Pelomonas candidula TaxID=3299025 RepID=A0ABW7HJ44_9BURK